MVTVAPEKHSFHWRQALKESLTFLVLEQAYVVHTDFNWVVIAIILWVWKRDGRA